MYPAIPFGPLTIPTSPLILLIAVTIGLEVAGRYGRRLGLWLDDVWNSGLTALLCGLIVARLWNVIQFWPIYIAEPWLIVSVRPSGFALLPGVIGAVVAAFLYMVRRALHPAPVTTALGVGGAATAAVIFAGGILTGTILGIPTTLPWGISHYGEILHPVALYYASGILLFLLWLWLQPVPTYPLRVLWQLCFALGLVLLLAGAYQSDPGAVLGWRLPQLIGWGMAMVAALLLASSNRTKKQRLPDDSQPNPVNCEGFDAEAR